MKRQCSISTALKLLIVHLGTSCCFSYNDGRLDIPFGGKVVVLGEDFRQILPVIPKEQDKKLFIVL